MREMLKLLILFLVGFGATALIFAALRYAQADCWVIEQVTGNACSYDADGVRIIFENGGAD